MSESKTQDNKLSLNKPGRLELKKTVETGQVRQSFSHGRTKAVTVEVKRKRTFERGTSGGMQEVPATGMAPALYHATVLQPEAIRDAILGALSVRSSAAVEGSVLDNEMAWLGHAPGWRRR